MLSGRMPVYAATIFLSAFLLFQIQPLIAKFILPWFGGSAAVWSAALLFFQLVLLAGYFYSHVLIRYLSAKQQFYTHAVLLVASLTTLPIVPSVVWKTSGARDPTFSILLLLGATVGLPYAILSATSPLLQAWYVRTHKGAIPYRLFALSNFGSMLALLSYPTLVEPRLTLHSQAVVWSWAFAVFALVCALAGWKSRGGDESWRSRWAEYETPAPSLAENLLWIGLAACASILLLAVTAHLTQNVAPIPLLWVVPLSAYLLTFMLCFESDRFYRRWLFITLLFPALGGMAYMIYTAEGNLSIKWAIPGFLAGLFVCCMLCHGELARRRPLPQYLTLFFLMVSIGGAIGGVFVALIAPRAFVTYFELEVGLVGCGILALISAWNAKLPKLGAWPVRVAILISIGLLAGYVGQKETEHRRGVLLRVRNFYGALEVHQDAVTEPYAKRTLMHGTINHGSQLLRSGSERIATSYYGTYSGISRALHVLHDTRGHLRIGILGLGAGVTATLANSGDTLHYYEINPLISDIATHQFGFVNACPAEKQILMGDARLVLESIPSERLDFLAMDAFSSDAVPIHLLTREAYQTYVRHLKPDGVLAVHISNRYLNLEPVVSRSMTEIGWSGIRVDDDGSAQPYYRPSYWTLLSRDPKFFDHRYFQSAGTHPLKPTPGFAGWTDDYSNLLRTVLPLGWRSLHR